MVEGKVPLISSEEQKTIDAFATVCDKNNYAVLKAIYFVDAKTREEQMQALKNMLGPENKSLEYQLRK